MAAWASRTASLRSPQLKFCYAVLLAFRCAYQYPSRVHLAHLRLRDYRNYLRLDADFGPGFHLLVGDNAQGKTNIIEAIYLLATLRSFRGVGSAQMVRHAAKGYFVGATIVSAAQREIKMYWSAAERKLLLDEQPVRRLTDYLGTLQAVVFCTEDLQLVKGTSRTRRRFLDLLLMQTQLNYLPLLQRYAHALRSRNSLLKQRSPDAALLDSFSQELVSVGELLITARRELLPRVGQQHELRLTLRDEFIQHGGLTATLGEIEALHARIGEHGEDCSSVIGRTIRSDQDLANPIGSRGSQEAAQLPRQRMCFVVSDDHDRDRPLDVLLHERRPTGA